nr:EOG090X0F6V [Artemia franciscana]
MVPTLSCGEWFLNYTYHIIDEYNSTDSVYNHFVEDSPFYKFKIRLCASSTDLEFSTDPTCFLIFTYTKKYPEEPPLLQDEGCALIKMPKKDFSLKSSLLITASNNLGMVMIFTLVSIAQEWLAESLDLEKTRIQEERERIRTEAEEAEKRRFMGTPVTVQNFLSWKEKFDAELASMKKVEKEDKDRKLTGRELFLRDKTLIESDLKYLEEASNILILLQRLIFLFFQSFFTCEKTSWIFAILLLCLQRIYHLYNTTIQQEGLGPLNINLQT